ncbi:MULTISPECIES: ATP-dependent helicase [unclassified Synechocystis]|uniref:ATP-dependent helicase n=1 Tax=unclassified Synechocystis TaxID=2640012 RepID=UPI000429D43D|nr:MULTISPECIES: UvrD-helicase domain-containing protein [unclassified Synechocystis]AIE75139.1 ATP-dependent DNA helicase UvrD/PcrA/Rep [Synechocystis sp. PCC 6714]MCT0252903.1 UvrD-helicase domain-containing protein [Synechocystis sp. CS-94]
MHQLSPNLEQLRQSLRSSQRPLADWQGGEMAVSAVPGAGKSHSLSVAAAIAIAQHGLHNQERLLIVTYTRSAAAAIRGKVNQRLRSLGLPSLGFTVQTLHGLALSIALRHPEVSGLDPEQQTLISPNRGHGLIKETVERWRRENSKTYQALVEVGNFDGETTETLRRQAVLSTEVLPELTKIVVTEAKSSGLSPQDVGAMGRIAPGSELLLMGAGLFKQYQALMEAKNWIDYNDMILAALRVLEEPQLCRQWQEQFFGVFEDEAQDSSPLQEKLLTKLSQNVDGTIRLIRVGDPNQAINSSFTPADPVYFNRFCQRCQDLGRFATMDQAGRSNVKVIAAANFLLEWVNQDWQTRSNTSSKNNSFLPFRVQAIRPVEPGDPQPNPPATDKGVEIHFPKDINEEVEQIRRKLVPLLLANPQHNAAILVRENRQGRFVADHLREIEKDSPLRVLDVGDQDRNSRIPREIFDLLQFIDRPHSPDLLKGALTVLQERQLIPTQDLNALAAVPEQFLYPTPLMAPLSPSAIPAQGICRSLLKARLELPAYQLTAFLGLTLNYDGSDLATLQKLSERLQVQIQPERSLKNLLSALYTIVNDEQFEAIASDSDEKYTKPGQITIITMHKAKGLDWDYVFLPFLHQDTLPGDLWVPKGGQFLGQFTLAEVARAQIRTVVHHQQQQNSDAVVLPTTTMAWQEARQLKEAEEYRLLYVAMTRAKRLLWLSAGQQGPFAWNQIQARKSVKLQTKQPSPALLALQKRFGS